MESDAEYEDVEEDDVEVEGELEEDDVEGEVEIED